MALNTECRPTWWLLTRGQRRACSSERGMKYEFLAESYETERVKVLSVRSECRDEDLPVRPMPNDPRGAACTPRSVTRFRPLQLSEGVPRVFQKLHLSQIRAQRVSCGSDCGNRGVASFLGCFSRLLGGVPKPVPLLSD